MVAIGFRLDCLPFVQYIIYIMNKLKINTDKRKKILIHKRNDELAFWCLFDIRTNGSVEVRLYDSYKNYVVSKSMQSFT